MISLLVMGCASNIPAPVGRAPEVDPVGQVVAQEVIDIAALAPVWSTAAGYHDPVILDLVELSGDGVTDAVVTVRDDAGGSVMLLVAGPLLGEKTLPGDEFASILSMPYLGAGDFDEDGNVDLGIGWGDGAWLPGPLAGVLDPERSIPTSGGHNDWDGDGHVDLVNWLSPSHFVAWYGPDPDPGLAPDLDLAFSCGPDSIQGSWNNEYPGGVRFWPDLTGDGVPDGTAPGYMSNDGEECRGFFFSVQRMGNYNPLAAVDTAVGVEPISEIVGGIMRFDVVPDQDGDAIPNVWLKESRTILASPISVASGAPIGGAVVGTFDEALETVVPTRFDFNADGIADFLGLARGEEVWDGSACAECTPQDFLGREMVVIVHGGPDGLTGRNYDTLYDFGHAPHGWEPFVEDGRGWLPATMGSEVLFVDLGAASEADATAPLR